MYAVLVLAIILLTSIFIAHRIQLLLKPEKAFASLDPNSKPVPIVSGSLPIVGNGLDFSRDIIAFISRCSAKYGPVFQMRLFRLNVVVIVCDRALAPEFFKAPEDYLSLYSVLDRLYFGHAFSDTEPDKFITRFTAVVKKSVAVKFDMFVPKIRSEATRLIDRLRAKCTSTSPLTADLTEEMMRFVSNTSAQCFMGLGLPEPIFEVMLQFTYLLNHIIVLTSYIPTRLIKVAIGWRVSALRRRICEYLDPEIESYRNDPEKEDSLVIRAAVDYKEDGYRELTNSEIAELLVCLLYVSTENTALGLSNTIIELVLHKGYWEELREKCASYLAVDDMRGLLDDPLLNACVMEAARLNTHIFPVSRKPGDEVVTKIGNYILDPRRHIDNIVFCPPLLQVYGPQAGDVFNDPTEYNPKRFIDAKESFKSTNIMTWGGGLHLCPGKMFALYEIKMAVALLITGFNMEMIDRVPEKDYFSPSAFAERKIKLAISIA